MYLKGGQGGKVYFLLNVVFPSNRQTINIYSRYAPLHRRFEEFCLDHISTNWFYLINQ